MAINTVSKEFFEEKYRASRDPWNFSSSPYELNRYDEIMRLLGNRTFQSWFRAGMLDRRAHRTSGRSMSSICSRWISRQAPSRWRGSAAQRYPNVTIVEGALPDDLPQDTFDLIVFSEIGYYFERGSWQKFGIC